jgi:TonB family protein
MFQGKETMSLEERAFPACPAEFSGDQFRGRFYSNRSLAGVVISLLLHSLFLTIFSLLPQTKVIPVRTFHISFQQQSSFVHDDKKPAGSGGHPVPLSSPPAPRGQRVAKRVSAALPVPPGVAREALTTPSGLVAREALTTPSPLPVKAIPVDETAAPAEVVQGHSPLLPEVAAPVNEAPASAAAVQDHFAAARTEEEAVAFRTAAGGGPSGVPSARTTLPGGDGSGAVSGGSPALGGYAPGGDRGGGGAGGEGILATSFGQTNAPAFIHRALPVYPALARRRGVEGRVVLTLLIDQTGKVLKIDVTEAAGYGLTEAAIEAVRKSTFVAASVNGRKVASRAVLPIRFRLE